RRPYTTLFRSKSEKPSEQRLRKARQEGQVARSRELQSAVLVLSGGMLLAVTSFLEEFSRNLMQQQFILDRQATTDPHQMFNYLGSALDLALSTFLPLFLTLWCAGLLSGMIPGGWLVSGKAVQPQLKRMNPLSGIKRMFSTQSLVELGKSLLKVSLLFGIMVGLVWNNANDLIQMNQLP